MSDRKPELPTPWRFYPEGGRISIQTADDKLISVFAFDINNAERRRLTKRIVAAVNAAEGKG